MALPLSNLREVLNLIPDWKLNFGNIVKKKCVYVI